MIRFRCPGCGVSLSGKDDLAGQIRPCPKCKTPITIPALPSGEETNAELDASLASASDNGLGSAETQAESESSVAAPSQPELGSRERLLERLVRTHHYLVCDRTRLLAAWENNGQGWMLKTNTGMVNAVRNRDKLPTQGNFKLVELRLAHVEGAVRLTGICTYQLARNWALANLARGDDQVTSTITGYGSLNHDQKNAVRQVLREQFMRDVWHQSKEVLDYLGNNDFHSHGVDIPGQDA